MPKKKPGGIQDTVEILNGFDPESRSRLLANIAREDPALAVELEKRLLSFESLAALDDAAIQLVLRETPQDAWAIALRSAPAELKTLILKNLPERAGKELREQLESGPQRRLSEVKDAQSRIIEKMRSLITDGKVNPR